LRRLQKEFEEKEVTKGIPCNRGKREGTGKLSGLSSSEKAQKKERSVLHRPEDRRREGKKGRGGSFV